VKAPNALWKPLSLNHLMDVVWPNRFKHKPIWNQFKC